MLTALTIDNQLQDKWYRKLFDRIRGNSLKVEIKSARGVTLRHIIYTNRNGRINWMKISSVIGSRRNNIICDENISLPSELGFRRFENTEFSIRLATNMGVYILSQLDKTADKIKVGFFDIRGDSTDCISSIIRYTSNVVIVTDNLTAFNLELRRIYEETGASIQATGNRIQLMDCDLVIAPMEIQELLPLSGNTIVLTGFAPTVCLPGLVYYSYYFRMPNKFDGIKPKEIPEEYFAGALYTGARQYQLGSIVPTVCSNYSSSQTSISICNYLEKIAEER